MPKKQKNTKRVYTFLKKLKPTNAKIVLNVSTLLKINKTPFKYQIGLKYILPGYATHEYDIVYQFRKNDRFIL